jgi:hypothetical protein
MTWTLTLIRSAASPSLFTAGVIFGLRSVVVNHRLIHGDQIVHHGARAAMYGSDTARDITYCCFCSSESIEDLSSTLVFRAQILVENGMDGGDRCPMGSSKRLVALVVIFNDSSQDYEISGPNCFFLLRWVWSTVFSQFFIFYK